MSRYICIHGHFYQPPRENPWFGTVEVQESAYPYHDWNERIAAECYGPNTDARVLDRDGLITDIVSNYGRISFSAGPTLLSWMERCRPDIYEAIVAADREGQERFGGHGPAIAQGYNHMILPLADTRDKRTQVVWGIRDFESRFGRRPEGMWLPETAVDLETLDIMAAEGIRFTILAPHQAYRVRSPDSGEWRGGRRRQPRHHCAVPLQSPLGTVDRALLLRRRHLARDRVRRSPRRRPAFRRTAGERRNSRPAGASARSRRHGRGDLRPPPPVYGDGARLLPPNDRTGGASQSHRLWRVPWSASLPTAR